jgi:hypothetical protein
MTFIPTAQDYLGEMEMKDWMNNAMNGSSPPSHKKIAERKVTREMRLD